MTLTPQATMIFVGIVALVLIPVYDVIAFTDNVEGNTISNVMASLAVYLPILPYWWGIGGAHLFVTAPPVLDQQQRVVFLVWSSFAISLISYGGHLDVSHRWHVVAVLVAGVLVGALLLSQRHSYGL